jgi:hypothetical protein
MNTRSSRHWKDATTASLGMLYNKQWMSFAPRLYFDLFVATRTVVEQYALRSALTNDYDAVEVMQIIDSVTDSALPDKQWLQLIHNIFVDALQLRS